MPPRLIRGAEVVAVGIVLILAVIAELCGGYQGE